MKAACAAVAGVSLLFTPVICRFFTIDIGGVVVVIIVVVVVIPWIPVPHPAFAVVVIGKEGAGEKEEGFPPPANEAAVLTSSPVDGVG